MIRFDYCLCHRTKTLVSHLLVFEPGYKGYRSDKTGTQFNEILELFSHENCFQSLNFSSAW